MAEEEHVDRKYKWFLFDLGPILKERAIQHRAARDAAEPGSEQRAFLAGQLLGFNEVVSILQQQADGFQIGRHELQLDDIEPDRDLT